MVALQEKTKTHGDCFAATKADADQSLLGKLRPSAVAPFRLLEAGSKQMFMGFTWGVLASVLCCWVVTDCCRPLQSWQAVVFKRSFDHVLRELSKLSGGVDDLTERGPVQK